MSMILRILTLAGDEKYSQHTTSFSCIQYLEMASNGAYPFSFSLNHRILLSPSLPPKYFPFPMIMLSSTISPRTCTLLTDGVAETMS